VEKVDRRALTTANELGCWRAPSCRSVDVVVAMPVRRSSLQPEVGVLASTQLCPSLPSATCPCGSGSAHRSAVGSDNQLSACRTASSHCLVMASLQTLSAAFAAVGRKPRHDQRRSRKHLSNQSHHSSPFAQALPAHRPNRGARSRDHPCNDACTLGVPVSWIINPERRAADA